EMEQSSGEWVGPRTPVEELVAGIMEEVLKRERVGAEENFFELGGHSLLATQVVSRIRRVFGVELPVRALFEQPAAAGLAQELAKLKRKGSSAVAPPIVPVCREQGLPLSYAQRRLWFIDQLEPGRANYNIPGAARLRGELDVEALRRSVEEIVRRHEVLRTRFVNVDGEPRQMIEEAGKWALPVVDLGGLGGLEREDAARELARAESLRSFDLSRGPLLRTIVLRLDAKENMLLATMHHIVGDGWSKAILYRELSALYGAFCDRQASPLATLEVQYGDYAVWQRNWLQGEVLEEQIGYWRKQLEGIEPLELPVDYVRPAILSQRGASIGMWLPAATAQGLAELSRRKGVTLFMAVLASWQALLSRYSGQRDIAIGSAVANRNRVETEKLIGFFVNTLVLRARVERQLSFSELLEQVRETVLASYEHQDVPFERVVEELAPERDLGRNPLFQVMLVLQNAPQE